jgi:hypothetical protein
MAVVTAQVLLVDGLSNVGIDLFVFFLFARAVTAQVLLVVLTVDGRSLKKKKNS